MYTRWSWQKTFSSSLFRLNVWWSISSLVILSVLPYFDIIVPSSPDRALCLSVLPYFDIYICNRSLCHFAFQFFLISTFYNSKTGRNVGTFSSSLFRHVLGEVKIRCCSFQFFLISTNISSKNYKDFMTFSSSLFRPRHLTRDFLSWNFQFFLISTGPGGKENGKTKLSVLPYFDLLKM